MRTTSGVRRGTTASASAPVAASPHDVEVLDLPEEGDHAGPDDGVVVDDEDADHRGSSIVSAVP